MKMLHFSVNLSPCHVYHLSHKKDSLKRCLESTTFSMKITGKTFSMKVSGKREKVCR